MTDRSLPGEEIAPADTQWEGTYRFGVGRPEYYDVMAATQFALLYALGLRESDWLADVGCGSLRAGRLLIPFLDEGHYYGIEPNEPLLRSGIDEHIGTELRARKRPTFDVADDFGLHRFGRAFDVVLAQSVFSHTYEDLAQVGLRNIAAALAPTGLLVATFDERITGLPTGTRGNVRPRDGSGWYTWGVPYTWRELSSLLNEAGLRGHRIRWWHHRQTWFVAARPEGVDAMRRRVKHCRHAVRGAPRLLRVSPPITRRLGLRRVLQP